MSFFLMYELRLKLNASVVRFYEYRVLIRPVGFSLTDILSGIGKTTMIKLHGQIGPDLPLKSLTTLPNCFSPLPKRVKIV